jgi:hypothetical protein
MKFFYALAACILICATSAQAQPRMDSSIPVTVDNFIRAESDLYLSAVALKEGGFGKFEHHRDVTPVDAQTIIRQNRDTLYSAAVFDLDAGPVTITLPDAGKRFMSLQAINEDEYSLPTIYSPGRHTLTKQKVGTRYVLVGVRTLVDPFDPADMNRVRALQDAIKVEQPGGPGKFEVPKWDPASQKKVRDALIVLGTTLTDTSHAFGAKGEVDPIPASHFGSRDLGRQPEEGRDLSQLHTAQERRSDHLQAQRQERAGRRLLVYQPLQPGRIFSEERPQRLFAQQHHIEEERRRLSDHPVRRLRWQNSKLFAHDARLELRGAALSSEG